MSAISIVTRGMISTIKVILQPFTTQKPKIKTVVEVTPKIRNITSSNGGS